VGEKVYAALGGPPATEKLTVPGYVPYVGDRAKAKVAALPAVTVAKFEPLLEREKSRGATVMLVAPEAEEAE
jgi:hypothetical protein